MAMDTKALLLNREHLSLKHGPTKIQTENFAMHTTTKILRWLQISQNKKLQNLSACLPLAVLATRVGRTMNNLSPSMSVFHIPY